MSTIGPAVVSLELYVMPAHVMAYGGASPGLFVLPSLCRYGVALYTPCLLRRQRAPGGVRRVDWMYLAAAARSGVTLRVHLSADWEQAHVRLRLEGVAIEPGALAHLPPDELATVLSHPLQQVRESALLALGR